MEKIEYSMEENGDALFIAVILSNKVDKTQTPALNSIVKPISL